MRWLVAAPGATGADVLYRGYGLALLLFTGKTYASADHALLTAPGAWAVHLLTLVGLALLLAGPRRALLAVASLTSLRCMVSNHRIDEPLSFFPAAEWPLFLVLPLGGLAMATDPGVAAWFRWAGGTALGFAGLHKLNTDWFDPLVTCHRLHDRLTEWWGLPPALHDLVTPGVVVAFELGAPLVLWRWPRLGLVLVGAMLAHFVGIGATALSFVLLVCALSFLPPEELAGLRRPLWGLPALGAAGCAALAYRGPWSMPQYAVTFACFAAVGAFAVARLVAAGPGQPAPLAPERRRLMLGVAALWLLNGLAPYAGLKVQYSFAMLSNLRVDDDRHNSLLFPASLRVGPDPYVHVHTAFYEDVRTGRRLQGGVVTPDLYTPGYLMEQRSVAASVGERLVIRGTWQGRAVTEAELASLPAAPLFRDRLTRGQPQACVH